MRRLVTVLVAALAIACGSSKDPKDPPPGGHRTAAPLPPGSPVPVTSFAQTVPDASGLGVVFPGQANTWVIDRDFSLAQGYGLQYAIALGLYVGAPTSLTHGDVLADVLAGALDAFPYDQGSDEVEFLTPLFSTAQGVVTAAASDGIDMGVPAISGTRSGYLNGTSDSRLSRTLSFAAGQTYTFAWMDAAVLSAGNLLGADAAPYAPAYQAVLRDPATGAQLGDPLFSSTAETSSGSHAVSRSGLPSQADLSFELRSAAGGFAVVDDVALSDGSGPIALANGDFEASGLSPWQANAGAESQNVWSGPRDVGTGSPLRITRTFYAPPSAAQARLVDVFENTGVQPVTTKAVYLTLLGGSTPHAAVGAGGEAVVGWDEDQSVRDVGIVSGMGTGLVEDGSPFVFVVHDLTVPAGGKVALVHFVVQLGEAEGGLTAPAETAAKCSAIAAGFPSDEAYAIDLEPGVLSLVANF